MSKSREWFQHLGQLPGMAPDRQTGGYARAILLALVFVILALSAIAFVVFKNGNTEPGKLLEVGWGKTNEVLSQRYNSGPLKAINTVAVQNADSSELSVFIADLQVNGQSLDSTLKIDVYDVAAEGLAVLADINLMGSSLDAQFYANKGFIGLGSKALFGNNTAYGATPGHFAEECTGGIFDPATGVIPMDPADLMELDTAMRGFDTTEDKTKSLNTVMETLMGQYKDFVLSVAPQKSKGLVPSTGEKATELTYVYPASKFIETLQVMSNTFWSSEYVTSYSSVTNMIGQGGASSAKAEWDQILDDLRKNYTGDFTVRYYLVDKTIAYLSVSAEPTYNGESVAFEAYIDFGLTDDTLSAELSLHNNFDDFRISVTSSSVTKDDTDTTSFKLESTINNSTSFTLSGSYSWDKASGVIQLNMAADSHDTYTGIVQMNASGNLTVNGTDKFRLVLDKVEISDGTSPVSFRLDLTLQASETLPKPLSSQNIFKLTENEFYQLYSTVMTALMSM